MSSQRLYLELKIIKADYLQEAGDRSAALEFPYCVVECGTQRTQTRAVQNAATPRWDEVFFFGGKGASLTNRDNCKITVIETQDNQKLGVATLNIGDLVGRDRQVRTLALEGHKRGRLQVETYVSNNPKAVRMQGQLRKEGGSLGGRTNWKTRWFVLYDDRYDYYENENAFLSGKAPKGTIMLDCFYCSPTENAVEFEFEVMAYPRRMTLKAASKREMDEWIDAMNNHIQKFNTMLGDKD
eukprot:g1366.t1